MFLGGWAPALGKIEGGSHCKSCTALSVLRAVGGKSGATVVGHTVKAMQPGVSVPAVLKADNKRGETTRKTIASLLLHGYSDQLWRLLFPLSLCSRGLTVTPAE
eukprot:scaffold3461_cov61-Phaeocystis_antarctica.AAC.3